MINNLKHRLFLFGLFLFCNCQLLFAQEQAKLLFNDNWEFVKADDIRSLEALEAAAADELLWKPITLPHDWSVEGPFSSEWASGTGFLPGGIGWYRKKFDFQELNDNSDYQLYFDGIYKNSEVWINGHYLGKRPNGFVSFFYEIGQYLNPADNEIIVKVDHREYADSRYYTGSGIYRNVYLITKSPIHFKTWGVFFSTPEVSSEKAMVKVQVDIKSSDEKTAAVRIKARLLNASNEVASTEFGSFVPAGDENHEALYMEVNRPKLWSPDEPNLYKLEVSLWADGKLLDKYVDQVGFRSIRFDADEGFFLNGENMLIKGVCIHHDAGTFGAAVPKTVWAKRLETLKDLGCNAIRMSHYPHQDYIYELCDEMGFLVQDEAFDEWERGKNKWIEGWNVGTPGNDGSYDAFEEWGHRDVQDMVLRSRNHPSIIMWSVGNEIDYPNDPYSHPVLDEGRNPQIYGKGYQKDNPPASQLGPLAEGLVAAVKAVDSTRPVTAALAGVTMSNHTSYPEALDIVGYNYQEYRYQEDHEAYPDRVIYGSENGDALSAWRAVTENKYIASQFLWTAFDFLGEARPWPSRSSGAGIIDMAGYPKPDFYFRKSLWNEAPMVYLGVTDNEENVHRRRSIQDSWTGEEGEEKWVAVYANVDEVELWLNGESLGRKALEYSSEEMPGWPVTFEKGTLKAVGFRNGKEVAAYGITSPGKADQLVVNMEEGESGIVLMDIEIQDKAGNRIVSDDRDITFEIDGTAKLLGLESGDLSSHEDYREDHRKTYQGRLRAYIQIEGEVKIKISTKGLKPVRLKMK
ncbi:glycoside hydrolase family 2 TIM barrel-domain containing protein [Echinicola shivajiensis]|uniref:glycoside hydrolase family 2 TIM barrel-domain containing protein n=1 Tax=Echinicola shivajiensis TaxID=1035916 RepID=UPI001BFCB7CC|nr:glycoside hydrolase family 2 TIM barrel-domain containing protein [Echinicola shivajiensis]